MFVFVILAFVASAYAGGMIFLNAKSAVHEIEGLLLILIAVLCFCTLAILDALHRIKGRLESPIE